MKTSVKIFIAAVITVIIIILLSSCGSGVVEAKADAGMTERFMIVDDYTMNSVQYKVFVDTYTKVQYLQIQHWTTYGEGEAVTVLVDADGRPLLWED
jgi:hypothetical protein